MNGKLSRKKKAIIGLGAAVLLSLVTTVDATFAQGGFHRDLILPDLVTTSTTPGATPSLTTPAQTTPAQTAPVPASLTASVEVNARVMSLVSLATRQVQLAKSRAGAQEVAKELIAVNYPKWDSSQVSCLNQLWDAESHWNYQSRNRNSGAAGIAQAMPANKMSSVGADWQINPVTQIRWGLGYVADRYGTPCKALTHHHWANSY